MDYREALNYIYALTNREVTPGQGYSPETYSLDRTYRLLVLLGNPQSKFASVHIAGTKGKGSTAVMIESVLRHANHLTGLFTSPHLHTFRERIRVGGVMIPERDVALGVERIRGLQASLPGLTTFEVMTALAFDYFVARGVEIAVLEVGLGGRLDSTNVVRPLVSAITAISYDHTAVLGNTLAQIAGEKAGIIKPGIPVVTAPQSPEALRVIKEAAHERSAPLLIVAPDLTFTVGRTRSRVVPVKQDLEHQTFLWERSRGEKDESAELEMPLIGRHQLENAATAIAVLSILQQIGVLIPIAAIREGLRQLHWPGRLEVLAERPYLIVDGAHNTESAQRLAEALRAHFSKSRLRLVFGASSDKDIAGMFAELLPIADSLILTKSHNPRAADPARLADLAAGYPVSTSIAPDVATALEEAQQGASPDDVICATGSLFVVADARAAWLGKRGIPFESDV